MVVKGVKKGVVRLRNDPMEAFKQIAVMAIGMIAVIGGITAAIFATDGQFGAAPGPQEAAAEADEPEGNETELPDVPGAPGREPLPELPLPETP